jgi:hypothetical protein
MEENHRRTAPRFDVMNVESENLDVTRLGLCTSGRRIEASNEQYSN